VRREGDRLGAPLAGDNESEALRILRELAPPTIGQDLLDHELGVRYRRLCESLLHRREAQVFRKPADTLLPKLQRWCARAIDLSPDDFAAHLLAADLAFYVDDEEATL
jgi:hypothetical protein